MKEVMAVIRMDKVNLTKKALLDVGIPGFSAISVKGRGKLVEDLSVIEGRKETILALGRSKEDEKAEKMVVEFLDGTRLFPRRLFTVLVRDEDVDRTVAAIIKANRTENKVGDGKIFILPFDEAIRIRTGDSGNSAL